MVQSYNAIDYITYSVYYMPVTYLFYNLKFIPFNFLYNFCPLRPLSSGNHQFVIYIYEYISVFFCLFCFLDLTYK